MGDIWNADDGGQMIHLKRIFRRIEAIGTGWHGWPVLPTSTECLEYQPEAPVLKLRSLVPSPPISGERGQGGAM